MIRTLIRTLAALTLAAALAGPAAAQTGAAEPPAAAPGDLLEVTPLGGAEPDAIQREALPLFDRYGTPVIEHAVEGYRIRFSTTDLDGRLTPITAQIFLPVLAPGAAPTALYAFGAGTTGVGDACAPSREHAYGHPIGHYRAYLQAYAGRGFVAILPDYLGFDDPSRPQAYFHAVAEGRVMLDAIRAAFTFLEQERPDVTPPEHVFTAGYSQGGHAAYAAADLRPVYAPEVPLHGMIGFAPTTNVERLLVEGPYYAPYISVSYASTYGEASFDPAHVLRDRWLPQLQQDTASLCVDRAQTHYPYDVNLIYNEAFAASLLADRLGETHPGLKRILDENRTGLSGHGLPSLIVQGGQDIIVRDPTQERFLEELCDTGAVVQYVNYPEARHRHTRAAGFEDSIAWMNGIVTGGEAPTSCPLVLSGQSP